MKWIALLIASIMLLSISAIGQQYSTQTSGGAPAPTAPTSPESLGLQTPSATASMAAPSMQEKSMGVMMTDQQSAYAAPSTMKMTATSPTYTQMIMPPGGYSPNNLYVSYAPQTVVGCNLYANLLLWMKIGTSGDIWFYEWYPNGMLDTNFAGSVYYPGWYKRWFFADVPGWHILQYYCNGWSNYAYIYVYGPSGYWVNPTPNPTPTPYPYPYPYPSPVIYPYQGSSKVSVHYQYGSTSS
jgi:hypothetical protein